MQNVQAVPDCRALFTGFFLVGITGFGGVLPQARNMLVDQRKWLSGDEFAEYLALGQVIPGPNIVNLAIALGSRFAGIPGALSAFSGLMLPPIVIVLLLAITYERYQSVPLLQHALRGLGAAAAGLLMSVGIKLLQRIETRWWVLTILLLSFVSIGVLRWPLPLVMLCIVPVSLYLAWLTRTRG